MTYIVVRLVTHDYINGLSVHYPTVDSIVGRSSQVPVWNKMVNTVIHKKAPFFIFFITQSNDGKFTQKFEQL